MTPGVEHVARAPPSSMIDDLLRPGMTLLQTHISWVLLSSEKAWKIKKPVDLGFLDFTTLEKRRLACEAELRLNARLAPRVYEALVPVIRDCSGHHRMGGSGTVVDWAVQMRRLPDAQRADVLVGQGLLTGDAVDALAEHLALFHAGMPTDARIASFGDPDVLLRNVRENFDQTREMVRDHVSDAEALEIEARQVGFIEGHARLLRARQSAGRIRDGHGDLRLEHVYLTPEGPTIIDCIEFNERFRYADVCADIAFLSMDLERFGRVDLAERLLARYARASGDFDLYSLVDFYEGYRAYVRGKIASMLAADPGVPASLRARARQDARHAYLLALSTGRAPLLRPVLIAVGGIVATGKSTIADHIGIMLSSPVVDTDRTRKALLGHAPLDRLPDAPWQGAYAPAVTARVYDEVFRRAAVVLESGRPVVLDASFRSCALRARAAELARRHGVPFFFVETRASKARCQRRLRRRARGPSVSDARPEIFDEFVSQWEPVTEIAAPTHLVVDTERPLEEVVEYLREHLPAWPQRMTQ